LGDEVVLDMTKAKTLEDLPDGGPYLASCSKMGLAKSQAGNDCAKVELTIMEPEKYQNRKMFDTISLDNENTLGRLKTLLIGLGDSEDEVNSAKFKFVPEDYVGRRCAVWNKSQADGAFKGQPRISRVRPESAYTGGEA